LDLIIEPSVWQQMMDDMKSILGESGAGMNKRPGGQNQGNPGNPGNSGVGPGPRKPPIETVNACKNKKMNDACSFTLNQRKETGVCKNLEGILSCLPPKNNPNGGSDPNKPPKPMGRSQKNPMWAPCTLKFEGKTWFHVGVRFKGNSTLSDSWRRGTLKLPMRFDFDEFEDKYPEIDDQRFFGFKKLGMASNAKDNSYIREKVAADIFREAGVPAAKTAFYRLFIDFGQGSKYIGLYTMVEIPDKPMLNRIFKNSKGNLYKPDGTGASFSRYDQASFKKYNNEKTADWSDVKSLYDALHAGKNNSANWRAALEKTFNVQGFLKYLAINAVIQNWDQYGMAPHNYFLYTNKEDGKVNWVLWDNNESLNGRAARKPLSLELNSSEAGKNWPLIRFLMDEPSYRKSYVSLVEKTIKNYFAVDKTQNRYEKAHALIKPFVIGAEGENKEYTLISSDGAFNNELNYLKDHVKKRHDDGLKFLEKNQK